MNPYRTNAVRDMNDPFQVGTSAERAKLAEAARAPRRGAATQSQLALCIKAIAEHELRRAGVPGWLDVYQLPFVLYEPGTGGSDVIRLGLNGTRDGEPSYTFLGEISVTNQESRMATLRRNDALVDMLLAKVRALLPVCLGNLQIFPSEDWV
jgi:hypothetical protein